MASIAVAVVVIAAVGVDVAIVVIVTVDVPGVAVQPACASMVHIKIRIDRGLVIIIGLLGCFDTKRLLDRIRSIAFFMRKHTQAPGKRTCREIH